MMALPLGVCISQASELVKRGRVNLYPADRLASLSPGNFLSSADWGLGGGRGQARKECLSGAVSTLLRKQVLGEQYLNHLEGFPGWGGGHPRVSSSQGWDGAQESAFLASSQVTRLLLAWGSHFESRGARHSNENLWLPFPHPTLLLGRVCGSELTLST